jgi:uncharacterized membrane protein YdjX (TVP38/TMEM64 family)
VDLIVMVAVVFAVNLLPAFGPPTWLVLAYFRIEQGSPIVALVILGGLAASAGRLVLALATRRLGRRLPERRRAELEVLGQTLASHQAGFWASIAFFALSPLPSAQMFEAAGLTPTVRLLPVTTAFFLGRLVSYSIYVAAASAARAQIRSVFSQGLGSPFAIALQLVSLGLVVGMVFTPWSRVLARMRRPGRPGMTSG